MTGSEPKKICTPINAAKGAYERSRSICATESISFNLLETKRFNKSGGAYLFSFHADRYMILKLPSFTKVGSTSCDRGFSMSTYPAVLPGSCVLGGRVFVSIARRVADPRVRR